jgi:hypothetical protein
MPDQTVSTTPAPGRPDGDPPFTIGLAVDVTKVIADHGYPPLAEGRDLLELEEHLFHLLHGREQGWHGCHGGAR